MGKRKCPRNPQQEGVCGCPSFWRHLKAIPKRSKECVPTPSTKSSSTTLVIESDHEHDNRSHHRKREEREDSVFPQAGVIGLSPSESLAYMSSRRVNGGCNGQKQRVAQVDRRVQESGSAKKAKAKAKAKATAKTPVRILVDYDLPTDAERLDWDTDDVRRMVGEIA